MPDQMDPTVAAPLRHRRSPSSDRFLDVFSFSPPSSAAGTFSIADEFNEEEVFFTNDVTEPEKSHHRRSPSVSTAVADRPRHQQHARRASFPHPLNSGILGALPDPERRWQSQPSRDTPVLYRKPSISATPSKSIPSIPRPPLSFTQEREFTQSAPARKFLKSAPMKVPVLSQAMMKQRNRDFGFEDDEIEEDEMLPPHEIVARGSARSPKTTYSVLEGVGRTLKGRDLRQVRNAVWRQTGFLD